MAMRQVVTYTPYATSSKEKTDDIITFTQFEEGNILSTEMLEEICDGNQTHPNVNKREARCKLRDGSEFRHKFLLTSP